MKRLLLLFIFTFGTVYSQNDSIHKLNEIILRGNFSPVVNSGYEVRVIPDSILKDNFESLGTLLQKQANFYFKQNGNGMVSSISLRGTSASQTGVYWNGIAINSALNGQTDFNTIQANSFDELEIRKGGGSVLLGNGAIGGAINVKDKLSFEKYQGGQLLLGAGSYETYSGQLTAVWSNESFYGKISGGGQSSENDYPYLGTELKNENASFSNYNLNTTLGFKLNDFNTLSFNASVFNNDRDLSRTLTTLSMGNLKNEDNRFLVDWKFIGNRFSSSLKLAYLHEDFTYLFDKISNQNSSFGESDRLLGKYDISYFLQNNLFFKAGLELENAKGQGSSISSVSRNDMTSYVLMHHQPLDRLMYNISFRAGASSAYQIPFIYALDLKYLLNDKLSLRSGFSTNYRLPTFNDLYWEPGGNPDLKPESSQSGELGIDFTQKSFDLSAATYFIKSQDLIQWRPVTQDFWQPENISNATNYGLEFHAGISHFFGDHFMKINASYDYTQAIDDETDQQLIYVPKHRAGAILDYHYKRWKFNYNMQYVGKVYITTSNTQNLDAYWLSDVSFYRSIYKNNIGLALKINNIFDISYQSVAYRPMPNRNYSIQINFKI